MKLVRVVWADHCDPPGTVWWTPEDYAAITGPATIISVGFQVRDEATWLAVSPHFCEDDEWGGQPTVIIKSCILDYQELRPSKLVGPWQEPLTP